MREKKGVLVYHGPGELARAAALLFIELAQSRVREKGFFTVALSGGRTPRLLYELLGTEELRERVPWHGVHLFWGDERCVDPENEESNYGMVRDALISSVDIPAENVHRLKGELDPALAGREYEEELRAFFISRGLEQMGVDGERMPVLDLVLLGLGADGHTLSLFPKTRALTETSRLVVENYVERLGSWRLTMTLPLVNAAANVVFLVTGTEKAEALKGVVSGSGGPWPACKVVPAKSGVVWLADEAAAGLL